MVQEPRRVSPASGARILCVRRLLGRHPALSEGSLMAHLRLATKIWRVVASADSKSLSRANASSWFGHPSDKLRLRRLRISCISIARGASAGVEFASVLMTNRGAITPSSYIRRPVSLSPVSRMYWNCVRRSNSTSEITASAMSMYSLIRLWSARNTRAFSQTAKNSAMANANKLNRPWFVSAQGTNGIVGFRIMATKPQNVMSIANAARKSPAYSLGRLRMSLIQAFQPAASIPQA